MGADAGRSRAALSGRDGEAQPERGRDHAQVRRRAHDHRDRRGSRAHLRRHWLVQRRHRVRLHGAGEEMAGDPHVRPGPPLWLLLELTYRCPLHCAYCSNPTDFARTGPELGTDDWLRVLREARALGAVQLGLSGGEPLLRDDLEPIVEEAHALGYYINLI